jgi:hypothetical protein
VRFDDPKTTKTLSEGIQKETQGGAQRIPILQNKKKEMTRF